MLEEKTAYEILGLKEGAGKTEIENRFTILLKKHRAQSQSGTSEVDMDKVTEAYNLLMGYIVEIPESEQFKPSPLLKKLGVDEKKARNFLYYYKFHILIGLVAIIAVFFTVKGIVTRVDPNLNVAFVGSFYFETSEHFKTKVEESIPELVEVSIDHAFLYPDDNTEQGMAMTMKATVIFAAQDVDVYILDKENFDKFSVAGAFMSLDGLVESLGIDTEANHDFYKTVEGEEQEEHLYGVDVSDNEIFNETGVQGNQMIAALGVRGEFYDNALELLKLLLE